MAQRFECPSCGAALDYTGGDSPVVRCAYCGGMVVVPEAMRAEATPQQAAWTAAAVSSPLTIDLSGLTGKVATLKAIKQLIHEGREAEAARRYQEAFGTSAEEADGVVQRLASGQGVVISSASFSTSLPVVSSARVEVMSEPEAAQMFGQAAEVLRQQLDALQQQQRQKERAAAWIAVGVAVFIIIVTLFALLAASMGPRLP